MEYIRWRFYTFKKRDPMRKFKKLQMPVWQSGWADFEENGKEKTAFILICFLPKGIDIHELYKDAFEISYTEEKEVWYCDRFPKPDYIK